MRKHVCCFKVDSYNKQTKSTAQTLRRYNLLKTITGPIPGGGPPIIIVLSMLCSEVYQHDRNEQSRWIDILLQIYML